MSNALIRFARRLANWEKPLSVEELQVREFKDRNGGPDLRPSVYHLSDVESELVRAYAEHAHSIDPPRETLALDVAHAAHEVVETPGDVPFSFARDRHAEVVMHDEAELHRFIETVRDSATRHRVTRSDTKAYVRARLEAEDEEWTGAANAEGAKSWLRKLSKAAKTSYEE